MQNKTRFNNFLNDLQSEIEKLSNLLKNRQEGLFTWWTFLSERLEAINSLIDNNFISEKFLNEFEETFNRWKKETGVMSSPTQIMLHKDFLLILTKGPKVIPLILKKLKEDPDIRIFHLLVYLAYPNNPAKGLDFDAGVEAWIKWGENKK